MGSSEAQAAVFDQIEAQAKALAAAGTLNLPARASIVRNLAMAYRLAAGGPQPGGVAAD